MKKILSIVIAAAMLLAISVPAFAAEINQSTSGGVGNCSGGSGRSGISGSVNRWFTPAAPLYWGADRSRMGYTG